MKAFIVLIISLLFFSCENKVNHEVNNNIIKDSLDFYIDKVDDISINDSTKLIFTKKAYNIINKLTVDSLSLKYYFTISRRFYNLNSDELYKESVLKTLEKAIHNKDTLSFAKAYLYLGDYYLKLNKQDSAFYFYDKSEVSYITKNDYSQINDVRLNKAIIQFYEKDFLGCENNVYKTLSFFKKSEKDLSLNICYTLLGLCQIETKYFSEADKNLKLALFYAEKLNSNTRAVETANNNLGNLFSNKGDYNQAIKYFDNVLNEGTKRDLPQIYVYAKQNRRYSKFKLGNTENFVKDYDNILKKYKELNLSTVLPYTHLSEFYELKNDSKNAQEYALKAYNISIKQKLFRDKLIALKQMSNVFPEKAKYYSDKYVKLSDSIAIVNKKTQNTFARIEYRIDELNNENLLLAERNKQIIYYALIIFLILLLLFVFFYQKQKQREYLLVHEQQGANEEVYNLMINQQSQMDFIKVQEQKRISQELHDGILGKLFGARMNLDFMISMESEEVKKEKQKYIYEIIEIEKQIRQISHELSDEKIAIIDNYQLLLDRFIEEQEALLKLKIDYSCNTKLPWEIVTAEEKINIYRIIQETFLNINKYAKTKFVKFSIDFVDNNLIIKITDKGVGFDVKKASKGIGFKNMNDRAKLIKAIYNIDSEINVGTTTQIILKVKINKEFII